MCLFGGRLRPYNVAYLCVNQVWKVCISGRVGCCGTGRKSVGSGKEEGMCVGLGDVELVRCCGRSQKGVGSGTEAGMWVGLEDVEWVRRSGNVEQVRRVREAGQRVRE